IESLWLSFPPIPPSAGAKATLIECGVGRPGACRQLPSYRPQTRHAAHVRVVMFAERVHCFLAERPAALGPGVSGEYAKIGSITAIDLALFVSLLVGQIVTTNLALHRGTGW